MLREVFRILLLLFLSMPSTQLYGKPTSLFSYPSFLAVETIYSIICECQTLFPDPEQSDSEEDTDEGLGDGA